MMNYFYIVYYYSYKKPNVLNYKNDIKKQLSYRYIMAKKQITTVCEVTSCSIINKKGRKPKGGKMVMKQNDIINKREQVTNIILHLKCTMADLELYDNEFNKFVKNPLQYDPIIPQAYKSFYDDKYRYNEINEIQEDDFTFIGEDCIIIPQNDETHKNEDTVQMVDIDSKLRRLKINLYKNANIDKISACFWCSYDFDNLSCFIPKYEIDGKIYGYGSFCCPECAAAYLMVENIDDSTKFERYHLLNQTYAKVFEYKENIKPAPNPFYLLDKYYGNLSIHEYRKLLKSEHLLIVIDKPLTRLLPELHEDNDMNEIFIGINSTVSKKYGNNSEMNEKTFQALIKSNDRVIHKTVQLNLLF